MIEKDRQFTHTWEEAINLLRATPEYQDLIYQAYLTSDLVENARRFAGSQEFSEVLKLIKTNRPNARAVLDCPGGNGIATYAFASNGFDVTTVEPDSSASVGRGAITHVLSETGSTAKIVEAFGENLPFTDNSFDIVYVRQGLHHAHNLDEMVCEYARVLRPGGLLLACREHVVDNYENSLQDFLSKQIDHQYYGGENAFMLVDYRNAIFKSGLQLKQEIEPYDSPINLHPNTPELLRKKIEESPQGILLMKFLPRMWVHRLGLWRLRRAKLAGRLYSFVAHKPVK
ncbi:class I SAM-dependent methyltransferase [Rhizobium leguminosarum]|uniref:Methyltransferase type 11 domain-containing protein n=1 Tax=Rhizobium leguminosarum TaxID=384 RepID=A0A2K9YY10_RHILE|nr:class I SAM-dependent methyltransferase [Rhizobium leguminosarum]AUW40883.1 hypothetical protein CUJ84_Chr000469 [Rhizobium leguminosarum]